jgi:hypothetical protein
METRTFDQIAQEFWTSAEQAHLPSDWTANAIDLYRAPCTSSVATAEAFRWSNALPNDPAGNITIATLSGHFNNAAKDLERALKIIRATSTPAEGHINRVIEIAKQANWQSIRDGVASNLKSDSRPMALLLRSLDAHIAMARAGKVQEAVAETAARSAEATRMFADVYAELAGGQEPKRKVWDDYWDTCASGAGAVIGFVGTAACYGLPQLQRAPA